MMKLSPPFARLLAPGLVGLFLALPAARSFPPAPHHIFYGIVRTELGDPLESPDSEIILETGTGVQIKAKVSPGVEPGANYKLVVPMDSGIAADAYQPTALQPTVPFKIRVRIGKTVYLPIEMKGDYARMGKPGQRTRLDLTLGEDSDGDGLPDAWERAIISQTGNKKTLQDIRPGDDADGDGLSNLQEYMAGTYAFDPKDGFSLKVVSIHNGISVLEFMAITGHTYTVLGSPDLKNWGDLPFQIAGTTAEMPNYLATDVRVLRIEVKPDTASNSRFFKLMVR